jgi:hypothetical protein
VEAEGERGGPGHGVVQHGGALPRDRGGRRGRQGAGRRD